MFLKLLIIDNEKKFSILGVNEKVRVIKRFEFASSLQRMSVIALDKQSRSLILFVKGSPEIIQTLWTNNTIPGNFAIMLEKYAREGLRVIAVSYRFLDGYDGEKIRVCKREEVEKDLNLLGFIVMENKQKPETLSCVQQLQEADIPVIMATGDNGLTAISVGRKCGIFDAHKDSFLGDVYDNNADSWIKWSKIESRISKDISYISNDASLNKIKSNKVRDFPVQSIRDEHEENGKVLNVIF